jgi:antitoxin component HigA of HigAB toxin-antitoxin module
VGIKANTGEIEMNAPRISRHETEYTATMARIDELMDAELGTSEGEELDRLTDRAIQYEFTEGDEHKLANAAPLSLLIRGLIDSVADLKESVSESLETRISRIIVEPGQVFIVQIPDADFNYQIMEKNFWEMIGIMESHIEAKIFVIPTSWEITTAIVAAPTERKPPERIIEL